MITSGYLIGQIIDDLSNIAQQAKVRNKLGHTDLSVFAENFFKDILNETLELSLINTNITRANEPGIDLADMAKKTAFQVTTDKTSKKVINTLEKITSEQRNNYRHFNILIIGDKQDKYEAVTKALANRSDTEESYDESEEEQKSKIHKDIVFDPNENIMDLTDLFRKIIGLDLVNIQKIHSIIQKEGAKVKIELQVPDENGEFQTNGYDLWESRPKKQLSDGVIFSNWEAAQGGAVATQEEIDKTKKDIEELASRLYSLPRITREFLAMLYERANYKRERYDEHPSIFYSFVKKTYPNADEEIKLLLSHELIDMDSEQKDTERFVDTEIGLYFSLPYKSYLNLGFYNFVNENEISFRDVTGKVECSCF